MTTVSGWQTYKRLLSYAARHWLVLVAGIFATAAYSGVEVQVVALIKYLLDNLLSEAKTIEVFINAALVFVLLILGRGFASFFSTYCIEWVGRKIVFYLRTELFDKYLTSPIAFFDQNTAGELISKATYNTETVSQAATQAISTVVKSGATILFALAFMFYTSWTLTLTFLVTAPLIAVIVNFTSKRFRTISKNIQDSMGDVTQVASEGVEGIKVVKAFGGQTFESNQMHRVANINRQQLMKLTVTKSTSSPLIQLIAALGFAVVFWRAGYEFLSGNLTEGDFAAFFAMVMMLMKPLKELSNVNSILQRGIAGAQSIFDVLDLADEKDTGTIKLGRSNGNIEFNDISFEYREGLPVIEGLNLSIKSGETVALVGPSGSGKSTLISLLLKFYHPSDGAMTIDGQQLEEIELASLREQYAFVSQQITLFNGTLRENIAYGALADKSEAELSLAVDNANLTQVVAQLEHGLDTPLGNSGSKLSGGQRQRVAIARALLKDAPILILDEATSALDNESERKIKDALDRLMKDRTTLVIAHRLSTIENADKIVVLKQGKIVEQGTHSDLIEQGGEYLKLYNSQFST